MKPIVPKRYHRLYEESAKNKVLEFLFKYPEREFSLSEIAKEASVAKANLGNILKEFYKLYLIDIVKLSKIWRIRANRENLIFQRIKIVHNLNSIYQTGLIEFLNDYFKNPKSIILFGSFRYGLDVSSSDIDIAIETDKEDEKGLTIYRLEELKEVENEIGRHINIHQFDKKDIDINLFHNLINGIVLSGFLEVNK